MDRRFVWHESGIDMSGVSPCNSCRCSSGKPNKPHALASSSFNRHSFGKRSHLTPQLSLRPTNSSFRERPPSVLLDTTQAKPNAQPNIDSASISSTGSLMIGHRKVSCDSSETSIYQNQRKLSTMSLFASPNELFRNQFDFNSNIYFSFPGDSLSSQSDSNEQPIRRECKEKSSGRNYSISYNRLKRSFIKPKQIRGSKESLVGIKKAVATSAILSRAVILLPGIPNSSLTLPSSTIPELDKSISSR